MNECDFMGKEAIEYSIVETTRSVSNEEKYSDWFIFRRGCI